MQLTVYCIDILLQQHPVPLPLHLRHADIQVDLLLRQQRMLDVRLDSTQQERPQDLVQLLDNGV